MGEKNSFKYSKKIAVAGILTALSAAALFLENIFPTGKLGFYVFAGFLLSVVIMECGILFGWISFAASSLLAFLLVPEKTAVVPYFLFFGIYSLVKSHIEKLNRIVVELVLKFVFFNAALFILWKIALLFIPQRSFEILPVFVIIVLLEILFFVYDWLFSLWIQFYQEKLQPKISK